MGAGIDGSVVVVGIEEKLRDLLVSDELRDESVVVPVAELGIGQPKFCQVT